MRDEQPAQDVPMHPHTCAGPSSRRDADGLSRGNAADLARANPRPSSSMSPSNVVRGVPWWRPWAFIAATTTTQVPHFRRRVPRPLVPLRVLMHALCLASGLHESHSNNCKTRRGDDITQATNPVNAYTTGERARTRTTRPRYATPGGGDGGQLVPTADARTRIATGRATDREPRTNAPREAQQGSNGARGFGGRDKTEAEPRAQPTALQREGGR